MSEWECRKRNGGKKKGSRININKVTNNGEFWFGLMGPKPMVSVLCSVHFGNVLSD